MALAGGWLLWIAVAMAGAATVLAAAGPRVPAAARTAVPRLLVAAAVATSGAIAGLAWALVTDDFTLVYVADHSRRGADAGFRVAGLWGGMAGSLLLWTGTLAVVAAIAARHLRCVPEPIGRWAHAVLGGTVVVFAVITATLAEPFRTLQIPAIDGGGLVPILEHSAMLYHPPVVYLSLALLVVPFAVTVATLVTGEHPRSADDSVRRWLLCSWVLGALGMAAGANWAYVELGWGGYWAWDPVENTALLPWLAVTARLHVGRRDPSLRTLRDGLALLPFGLALMGTWLTRSGAVASVHAFALEDAIGRALLVVVIGSVALSVFALVRSRRTPAHDGAGPSGRDRALDAQAVLIGLALVVITAGTLAPVVIGLRSGDTTAIDGSYFARFTAPIVIVLLVLMAVGPRLGTDRSLIDHLLLPGLLALAGVAGFLLMGWRDTITLLLVAAAVFAGASSLGSVAAAVRDRRGDRRGAVTIGAFVAHTGFALLLVGLAGSTAGRSQVVLVGPGAEVSVAGVVVRNQGATTEPGPPPRIVAPVEIVASGRHVREVPSIVGYPERGELLAETALWSTPGQDVQVALRRANDDGSALLEIHVRPLAWCVWWGAVVLAAGGALALVGRRRVAPCTTSSSTSKPPAGTGRSRVTTWRSSRSAPSAPSPPGMSRSPSSTSSTPSSGRSSSPS